MGISPEMNFGNIPIADHDFSQAVREIPRHKRRMTVVLPLPDCPTMETKSPGVILKVASFNAVIFPGINLGN